MRSLAYDIGRALGCGGHLKSLVRRRCGPFKISEAAALSDAESKFADGAWRELLYAPDVVVSHMRSAIVGDKVEKLIRDGRVLPPGLGIPFSRPDEQCRVYGTDGRFIAIMSFNASLGQWKPDRVFGTS